jgi:hypothetical protein
MVITGVIRADDVEQIEHEALPPERYPRMPPCVPDCPQRAQGPNCWRRRVQVAHDEKPLTVREIVVNSGLLPAARFRNLRNIRNLTAGRLGRHACYAGFREGARNAISTLRLTHMRPRGAAVHQPVQHSEEHCAFECEAIPAATRQAGDDALAAGLCP